MVVAEWPCPNKKLKYDKGENRHKHVGKGTNAQLIYENGILVGKCPKGFSFDIAQKLLENGIPEFRKTAEEKPFRIWSYYKGAIYVARSQDGGSTWHGYPAINPPREISKKLEQLAQAQGEEKSIKQWLKKTWNSKE